MIIGGICNDILHGFKMFYDVVFYSIAKSNK